MSHVRDHLIIGAGPAGLQLAYFLQRARRDYVVLEGSGSVGSFFERFPRHRKLISINKVHTGYEEVEMRRRWDWNCLLCDDDRFLFGNYSKDYFPSADVLVRYLRDFAAHYELNVRLRARVTRIEKRRGVFLVTDAEGRVERARNVIVATGLSRPHLPDIPGIEHAEDYSTMSVDPEGFAGQRVLILGKGNSAFETADNLIATASLIHVASPESLDFAWRSHYVGHLRAVNNNFLDTYQLKSQNAVLDARVEAITKSEGGLHVALGYEHADGEAEVIRYDRVITCTGFRFDAELFADGARPELAFDGKFPDMGSDWQSTNVRGLYFAGVLSHRLDYRKKQSGFIHGFRYNVECLAKLLEERCHGVPYPSARVSPRRDGFARAMLDDVNGSSALWQQSGFLCSALVPEADGTASYYKNMPIAYAHRRFASRGRYWLVMLDFGQERLDSLEDVFRIPRVHKHDVDHAHLSTAIHPVISRCSYGEVQEVHHVLEDLRSEWHEDHHLLPLADFVRRSAPEEALTARAERPDIDRLLEALDAGLDPRTGFLPRLTPICDLPPPFEAIREACEALPSRYHGEGKDARAWLSELFAAPRPDWIEALDRLDRHTLEGVMTQTSLLCHAARWQSMPASAASYRLRRVDLPPALEALWSALAARMGVPRVGIFYSMASNNWRLRGVPQGSEYDPASISEDTFEVAHSWLLSPEDRELRAFLLAAVSAEAAGARVGSQIRKILKGIQQGRTPEVIAGLEGLRDALREVLRAFNQSIRLRSLRPQTFMTALQPTMIWMLDHGEGPLEGANGPQCCTIQLLDGFLGVERGALLGGALLESRRYMLPEHRAVIAAFDGAGQLLREFAEAAPGPEVRRAYNACLKVLLGWRRSHHKRGAMYLEGQGAGAGEGPGYYASTGMVVKLDDDRLKTFEAAMLSHIEETRAAELEEHEELEEGARRLCGGLGVREPREHAPVFAGG